MRTNTYRYIRRATISAYRLQIIHTYTDTNDALVYVRKSSGKRMCGSFRGQRWIWTNFPLKKQSKKRQRCKVIRRLQSAVEKTTTESLPSRFFFLCILRYICVYRGPTQALVWAVCALRFTTRCTATHKRLRQFRCPREREREAVCVEVSLSNNICGTRTASCVASLRRSSTGQQKCNGRCYIGMPVRKISEILVSEKERCILLLLHHLCHVSSYWYYYFISCLRATATEIATAVNTTFFKPCCRRIKSYIYIHLLIGTVQSKQVKRSPYTHGYQSTPHQYTSSSSPLMYKD